MTSTATRTEFRPSTVAAGEWETLGYFYAGEDTDTHAEYRHEHADLRHRLEAEGITTDLWTWMEDLGEIGCCHSCGASFFHGVVVRKVGTEIVGTVGGDCGATVFRLGWEIAQGRKAHERHAKRIKAEMYLTERPALVESFFILACLRDHSDGPRPEFAGIRLGFHASTSHSIWSALMRYGDLSEKQEALIHKLANETIERLIERAEREAQDAERFEPIPEALIDQRSDITGQIVHAKWVDSDYGGATKILVIDDRGFKVWGTLPRALDTALGVLMDEARHEGGDYVTVIDFIRKNKPEVKFTARIEASKDDPTFGFYSRPTKAEVTSRGEEATS